MGRVGSFANCSTRSGVISSASPSVASALSKMTRTWVEVSSIDTSVSIQRRLTTSTIANAARLARGKCVTSQHQILLGSHLSQSGHSTRGAGSRGGGSASTSP